MMLVSLCVPEQLWESGAGLKDDWFSAALGIGLEKYKVILQSSPKPFNSPTVVWAQLAIHKQRNPWM